MVANKRFSVVVGPETYDFLRYLAETRGYTVATAARLLVDTSARSEVMREPVKFGHWLARREDAKKLADWVGQST